MKMRRIWMETRQVGKEETKEEEEPIDEQGKLRYHSLR